MLFAGVAPVTGGERFQMEKNEIDPNWRSKIWFRMRAEGRVHKFDKKRAELRAKYKQKGYTGRAARDMAWFEAEKAFPPLRPKPKSDEVW